MPSGTHLNNNNKNCIYELEAARDMAHHVEPWSISVKGGVRKDL